MTIAEESFKTRTSFLLPFEKLHGLGNDFIIINSSHLDYSGNTEQEQKLCTKICDRNFGIGADGLIIIDSPKESTNAIRSWRYYNSDGSIGEMCGNGIRCAAKYIYEHGLSNEETQFKIETLAGDIGIQMLDDDLVKVNMGSEREKNIHLNLNYAGNKILDYDFISMGNPHAISFFNDLNYEELKKISQNGSEIEINPVFPNKTNVEFAKIINETEIDLIVWERGCGFTKACGTGACATVVSAIKRGYAKPNTNIKVNLPGGSLVIAYDEIAETIFMTGPSLLTCIGYFNDER